MESRITIEDMIKNNIEVDVKVKCIENGTTQAQLAETIGTTGQYVNRIIKKQDGVVNRTFVQMLEALGYDIELTRAVAEAVSVPVIASGGAGTMAHFYDALTEGKADAALAASLFHYKELEIRDLKEYLASRSVSVRL